MFGLFKQNTNVLHEHKFKRINNDVEELNILDEYGLKRSDIIDGYRAKYNWVYKCKCGKIEIKSFVDGWDI